MATKQKETKTYSDKASKKTVKLEPEELHYKEELNKYLKSKIFNIEDEANLPSYLWVRLEALRRGKKFIKNNSDMYIQYTYYDIYVTFALCEQKIKYALYNRKFNNDVHRINTVMKIVEDSIMTVKESLEKRKKELEKKEEDMEKFHKKQSTYIIKSKDNNNEELEQYW